jgi:hypothetical protein
MTRRVQWPTLPAQWPTYFGAGTRKYQSLANLANVAGHLKAMNKMPSYSQPKRLARLARLAIYLLFPCKNRPIVLANLGFTAFQTLATLASKTED